MDFRLMLHCRGGEMGVCYEVGTDAGGGQILVEVCWMLDTGVDVRSRSQSAAWR